MLNPNTDTKTTGDSEPSAFDLLEDADGADDVDVEMALLSLSAQDMGEPTEAIDLSALSEAEKRALLALLRQRLHLPPSVSPNSESGKDAAP